LRAKTLKKACLLLLKIVQDLKPCSFLFKMFSSIKISHKFFSILLKYMPFLQFSDLFTRFSWKYMRSDATQLLGSFSVCLRPDRGSIVIRNLRLFVCNASHSGPAPPPNRPAHRSGEPNAAFCVLCVELSFRIWFLPYSSY